MATTEERPRERRRELRLPEPEIHLFPAADGAELRLIRYRTGTKGPLIVAPGFGTSTAAYTIDTVETNFPEFLAEHDYDIWLLDYRASPELEASRLPNTVDEIATLDWPAAVAKVREVTGAESVQVNAHCVGSMSFQMALLSGLEGVRHGICSCLGLFPEGPGLNKAKARLHIGPALTKIGIARMSTDYHPDQLDDRVLDALMHLYPTKERCENPVCRRIEFLYGDVYDHDRLNDATHWAMHEWFGRASITTLSHVGRMLLANRLVDKHGRDTYLPHAERMRLPLTWLHGEHNNLFRPEGARRTIEWLSEQNGPDDYRLLMIEDYAHMDCWIGEHAARDVFPLVLEELDRHN
jgi:pimeloyl-ACP methyl ester carboxylesterase